MVKTADVASKFLKLWKAESTPFSKALMPTFRRQHKRVLQRFADLTGLKLRKAELGPESAALLYPPGQFTTEIMKVANDQILRGFRRGARTELSNVRVIAKRVSTLPLEVQEKISDALDKQFNQDFWEENFSRSTRRRLANVLFRSMQEGWTLQETADFLRQDRFGIFSIDRALRIARTETTGALNGGAWIARQEAIRDGSVIGEEWNAILDARLRNTHRFANGQVSFQDAVGRWMVRTVSGDIIADGREFVLGDERARYPGDPKLSAENRVNCRCVTTAVV